MPPKVLCTSEPFRHNGIIPYSSEKLQFREYPYKEVQENPEACSHRIFRLLGYTPHSLPPVKGDSPLLVSEGKLIKCFPLMP